MLCKQYYSYLWFECSDCGGYKRLYYKWEPATSVSSVNAISSYLKIMFYLQSNVNYAYKEVRLSPKKGLKSSLKSTLKNNCRRGDLQKQFSIQFYSKKRLGIRCLSKKSSGKFSNLLGFFFGYLLKKNRFDVFWCFFFLKNMMLFRRFAETLPASKDA